MSAFSVEKDRASSRLMKALFLSSNKKRLTETGKVHGVIGWTAQEVPDSIGSRLASAKSIGDFRYELYLSGRALFNIRLSFHYEKGKKSSRPSAFPPKI